MMLSAFKQRIEVISAKYPNVRLLAEYTTNASKPKAKQTCMHPEEIKAAIRISGYTQAMIAEELGISAAGVSKVIAHDGSSEKVETFIANLIGKDREEIFPKRPSLFTRHRVEELRRNA